MSLKNTATTYGSVAKFFHWLIFFLLIFIITLGYFLDEIPKESQPVVYNIHKLTGLSILTLMILRGIWALFNIKPLLPMRTHTWERWVERLVHWLLYAAVIAMPLAGWIGSSAAGHPPHLGDYPLLLPVPASKTLAESSFDLHNKIAIIIIVLFCVHAIAALFHHFIRKDEVLKRMLPGSSN